MNKKQAERFVWLCNALGQHGLTVDEVQSLLRAERTLTRWACRECGDGSNWHIEREELPDGDEGRPFNVYHGPGASHRYAIPDLERGAIARAQKIAARHGLTVYRQGDPRGCALYVLRTGDVPEGRHAGEFYNRGIAVCID